MRRDQFSTHLYALNLRYSLNFRAESLFLKKEKAEKILSLDLLIHLIS